MVLEDARKSAAAVRGGYNGISKKTADQLRGTMAKYEERQKDEQMLHETSSKLKKQVMRTMRMSRSMDSEIDDPTQDVDDAWNAEERLSKAMRGGNKGYIIKYSQYVSQKDIRKLGVEKSALIRAALDDEFQRKTCISFPLILAYLSLFMIIFQEHYGVSFIFLQQNQMRKSLVEPIHDVQTKSDIFEWMDTTLTPYLWSFNNVGPDPNNALSHSRKWPTANQKLVGGLVLRTVRGGAQNCSNSLVQHFECFDEMNSVPSNDDPVFSGWRRDKRRLSDAVRGARSKVGEWAAQWSPGSFSGDDLEARRQRHEAAQEARRKHFRRHGIGRTSLRETKKLRKAQRKAVEAQRQAAEEDGGRRLNVINAHMKDSVPNLGNFGNYIYQYFMPMSMGEADVKRQLADWQTDATPLITNTTIVLQINFLVLNPSFSLLGRSMLTNLEMSFLFSRGGTIFVENHFSTMLLQTSRLVIAGLAMWGVILLAFTFTSFFKLHTAVVHGDVCSYFMHFNNFMEWLLVTGGWIIVALVVTERLGVNWFNNQWMTYEETRKGIGPLTIKEFDKSWLIKFEKGVQQVAAIDDYAQIGVAFYHIALVFRILVASQGHPRLAIVVNTISQGFNDLIHLFIVFIIIFISFVMMGFILFGNRMGEFATIKGSLGYCMQIVLQRQYDNETIQESDYITSLLWIVCFVVVVVLVVVNIVLAMIFDNYGDVVKGITPADTVWNTMHRQWRHFRNGNWLSNSTIVRCLEKANSKELITKQRFLQLVPSVSGEQIDELYDSVKVRLITMVARGRKNIVPEALAAILLGVEDMREGVAMMAAANEPLGSAPSTPAKTPLSARREKELAVKAPEPGEQEQDSTVAPAKCPYWVEEGLLRHLHKRQAIMDQLFLQIQQLHSNLRNRGLGTNCDELPMEEPEQPPRDGSQRLDATLTGDHMKPMVTPGLEREKPMAEEPRPTIAPAGGFSMAKRLKKA